MTQAQKLLQLASDIAIHNPDPDSLAKVAEITDILPINRKGIEDEIALLQHILNRSNNRLGRGSRVQGMANVGILKLSM